MTALPWAQYSRCSKPTALCSKLAVMGHAPALLGMLFVSGTLSHSLSAQDSTAAELSAVAGIPADSMEAALGLRARFKGLVERDQIKPQWLDDSRAWYVLPAKRGPGNIVIVDALGKVPRQTLPSEALLAILKAPVAEVEHLERTDKRSVVRVYLNNRAQWLLDLRTLTAERIHDLVGYDRKRPRPPGTAQSAESPGEAAQGAFQGSLSPNGQVHAFLKDSKLWVETIYRGSRYGAAVEVPCDESSTGVMQGPVLWSPDGASLVCFQTEPAQEHVVALVDSSPEDRLQPKLLELKRYLKPGDEIERKQPQLFKATGDSLRPLVHVPIQSRELFANPWSIKKLRWDGDCGRFTFLYNERGHRVMRWIGVDAVSGEAKAVINETPDTFFDYANKLYHHVLGSEDTVLWTSERSGWNHLYAIDTRSGEARAITSGEWLVRGVEHVNESANTAVLRVMGRRAGEDPYHVHFVRVNLATGSLVELTQGNGTHALRWSPDRRWYIDSWSRVDRPPVWELRRSRDGSLVTTLERADASALTEAGWRLPQAFVAKGRDGTTDIHGVVYRPTHWSADETYPVIESIYAGPHGAHVPKHWSVHRKQRELAELGFIVVQIDGMGTNWRSKAFHDVAWKNLGDAGFPDRIPWLRALAETDATLDLERVGIYGGSAGGQNAMRALIAHHEFYGAAVADCGCHDNRMDKIWWNEMWMSWPIGPHYDESSNVVHAHRMQGALLLIAGELDRNVDPSSTLQVVDALIKADKDFELLILPGEGHGAAETPYGTRRRRDFFRRKLLTTE